MIKVRRSKERGHASHGWLDTYHTFSFADYMDPKFMGFRSLRVINEDWVEAGKGFGTHPHRDMEILTYVLEGELEHKDNMGSGSVIRPGDVQLMSAGTGVTHSEFNHSLKDKVHLLQIWILPVRPGLKPTYQQKNFSATERTDRLCPVASADNIQGTLKINQDATIYAAVLSAGAKLDFKPSAGRHVWIQLARGELTVNDVSLRQGDGAAISEESLLRLTAAHAAEILLFDLA